jgi:hypothetical protein
MESNERIQDHLRFCAEQKLINQIWVDRAKQLMLWAADALDAADKVIKESEGK